MASTSSTDVTELESVIRFDCLDGFCNFVATASMFLELNYPFPCDYIAFLPVTTRIMSIVMKYVDDHDAEFIKLADPWTLLALTEVSYFFDHKELMYLTCQRLVSIIKGKSVKEIRTDFIINEDYDGNSTEKPSKRAKTSSRGVPRMRRKHTFIMPPDCDYVQRSHHATVALHSIYNRRWKSIFDRFVGNLFKPQSNADMLHAARALASLLEDQVLAGCLEHGHVVRLFNMLEQRTPRREIERKVLLILSRVNFTVLEKAMGTDRIQLLVKVIDDKIFGIYSNEMAPLAVLTLTNIVQALPQFVGAMLDAKVLEIVQRVLLAPRTVEIVKRIAMFLVAVCGCISLPILKNYKVDLALATLQVLELRVSLKHDIEQACNAFQYLTHGRELRIEELALKKLIEKLIAIIQKPPPGNCQFPGYALRVLGNIVFWGSSDQIKILASNFKFLESLVMAMTASSKKIQKEACRIISQIALKMEGLIEEMHSARLMEALCGLLEKGEDESVKSDQLQKMENVTDQMGSSVIVPVSGMFIPKGITLDHQCVRDHVLSCKPLR